MSKIDVSKYLEMFKFAHKENDKELYETICRAILNKCSTIGDVKKVCKDSNHLIFTCELLKSTIRDNNKVLLEAIISVLDGHYNYKSLNNMMEYAIKWDRTDLCEIMLKTKLVNLKNLDPDVIIHLCCNGNSDMLKKIVDGGIRCTCEVTMKGIIRSLRYGIMKRDFTCTKILLDCENMNGPRMGVVNYLDEYGL